MKILGGGGEKDKVKGNWDIKRGGGGGQEKEKENRKNLNDCKIVRLYELNTRFLLILNNLNTNFYNS